MIWHIISYYIILCVYIYIYIGIYISAHVQSHSAAATRARECPGYRFGPRTSCKKRSRVNSSRSGEAASDLGERPVSRDYHSYTNYYNLSIMNPRLQLMFKIINYYNSSLIYWLLQFIDFPILFTSTSAAPPLASLLSRDAYYYH